MDALDIKYNNLHKKYLDVGGAEFDESDIDQSAISYAYNTCGLEGNTITMGETETIILTGKVVPGKSLLEHLEIKDAYDAFRRMFGFIKENYPTSEALAMTFHKLNTKSWLKEEWSGQYKTIQTRVGGRSTPYPEKAKVLFKSLFIELNKVEDHFDRAAELHLNTVMIHPWQDGNGRTARLLMNFELVKNGHGHLQIGKDDKDIYFKAIRSSIEEKRLKPFKIYLKQLAVKTYEKKIAFLSQKKKIKEIAKSSIWDFNEKVELYN